MTKKLLACAFAAVLTACAGVPERNVPADIAGALPDQFTDVAPSVNCSRVERPSCAEAEIPVEWWRAFGDPQLDQLVIRGLKHNSDLLIAAQRLREARAAMGAARAEQMPNVGAFITGARERGPSLDPNGTSILERSGAGASVSYEIDLWGRLASQTEAARRRYLAQGYTLAALRLTIAAELVRGYLATQALMESRTVLEENVQVLQDQLRLSERRYQIGAISELDLQRFRSELEDSRAQLAQVVQQQQATQRALVLLAGELPTQAAASALEVNAEGLAPADLPDVPSGLPSSLLDRRPDLRAAEANLAAAGADLSAARRAWFPSLAITGAAGVASSGLSGLFKDGLSIWSITANLAQAIFDGGRRSAAIEASDARREQLAETYRNTVRRSFKEVLDALDARSTAAEVYRARNSQAQALATTLRLAQRRYDEGYSDYLGVLDARRSLLQSRLALAEARRSGGAAYVDLALAVGGGWEPSPM